MNNRNQITAGTSFFDSCNTHAWILWNVFFSGLYKYIYIENAHPMYLIARINLYRLALNQSTKKKRKKNIKCMIFLRKRLKSTSIIIDVVYPELCLLSRQLVVRICMARAKMCPKIWKTHFQRRTLITISNSKRQTNFPNCKYQIPKQMIYLFVRSGFFVCSKLACAQQNATKTTLLSLLHNRIHKLEEIRRQKKKRSYFYFQGIHCWLPFWEFNWIDSIYICI